MSLHHTIARDSSASRRWRRYAPLLLVLALTVLVLAPGAIYSNESYQISLCAEHETGPDACAQRWRAALSERNLVR